jgi:hypothetical protein
MILAREFFLRCCSPVPSYIQGKLLRNLFRPLKRLVQRLDRLMPAAGFPVIADRFNQVLNHPSPVRKRFPDSIAYKPALDTDILYGRRRENDAVFIEDATQFLQDVPCGLIVGRTLRTGCLAFKALWQKTQNTCLSASRSLTWHSQRTSTSHPSRFHSSSFSRSRATFRPIFGVQYSALVSGVPAPSYACMAVPEAAAHIDNLPEAWKNHAWASRQTLGMEAVTVSEAENELPQDHLGLGILCPDRRHVTLPLHWCQPVHQLKEREIPPFRFFDRSFAAL